MLTSTQTVPTAFLSSPFIKEVGIESETPITPGFGTLRRGDEYRPGPTVGQAQSFVIYVLTLMTTPQGGHYTLSL